MISEIAASYILSCFLVIYDKKVKFRFSYSDISRNGSFLCLYSSLFNIPYIFPSLLVIFLSSHIGSLKAGVFFC